MASRLGFAYVDSGALYRALAYAARSRGVSGPEDPLLEKLLSGLLLRAEARGDLFEVFVGGENLTRLLRDPEISSLSSRLAVHAAVREKVWRVPRTSCPGAGPQ